MCPGVTDQTLVSKEKKLFLRADKHSGNFKNQLAWFDDDMPWFGIFSDVMV